MAAPPFFPGELGKRRKDDPLAPEERGYSSGPPEVEPTEVVKEHVLGDGSFGTVYQGRCREKKVAIKVLHKQELDAKTLEAFRKEVEIMSKIYHPNVVLFMGACTVPGSMVIVTELMAKGDLETMLQNKNMPLSLVTRLKMAQDAALGMNWLHQSNPAIIHRDLKTANLLIDEHFTVKVCDFGLSQVKRRGENLHDGSEGAKGTPLWMAPEVLSGQPFNEKADVYSFGIVMWEILTKEEPFQEFENFETFRAAVCRDHVRPPIPAECPPKLRALITACWDPLPRNRPSFQEIVTQLDDIILDISIADEMGKKLWRDYFPKKTYVKWTEFMTAFQDLLEWSRQTFGTSGPVKLPEQPSEVEMRSANMAQLEEFALRSPANQLRVNEEIHRRTRDAALTGAPFDSGVGADLAFGDDGRLEELGFKCLHALLAEKPQGVLLAETDWPVTLENWGKLLAWFGPLVVPGRGVVLLDLIRETLSRDWFQGNMDTREAEGLLASKVPGYFLIRFSTSAPGAFTISKVSVSRTVNHQRIQHVPGEGFHINNRIYPSLDLLVAGEAAALNLAQPCGPSKYAGLFIDQKSSGYVQTSFFS